MRWSLLGLLLLPFFACGGDIEKENVATTQDAGAPVPIDGSTSTLDATVADASTTLPTDGGPVTSGPCTKSDDCNGGTCFEGMCMCQLPKYVQTDGRCGDAKPPDCAAANGTCRQGPAECTDTELEGDIETDQSCGDFAPAVCCFPAASCKLTKDFVCCGASTTPYEPTCVNGWRTCMGLMPKLRDTKCP
jgi:hypothetical protein